MFQILLHLCPLHSTYGEMIDSFRRPPIIQFTPVEFVEGIVIIGGVQCDGWMMWPAGVFVTVKDLIGKLANPGDWITARWGKERGYPLL